MKKYWVYVHTCTANGKKYVGVTTASKPEIRWKGGRGYQCNKHFYSAILKHGWDNFEHEVFEVDSAEEMYRKEVELISFYHSNDPRYGYNNSVGGEHGHLGCKHSEESKKKMSEAHKGKPRSEETKKKLSEFHKGKPHPGKPLSEETKKKMSEAHKGKPRKPHSEETKRRIAEAHRGKPRSEETRKKISEAMKDKLRSEEARKKISEALKGRIVSEEVRKHMSEAHKGKPRSEEARKHMAEAKKGKPKPKVKIKLPDETIIEISKQSLTRFYINKGKEFEYVP